VGAASRKAETATSRKIASPVLYQIRICCNFPPGNFVDQVDTCPLGQTDYNR
jgi:hypothetical protein